LADYLAVTGATQWDVARAVGSTQANISRIAAGSVMPNLALALRLSTLFHISLDSFTRLTRKKKRNRAGLTSSAPA